MTTADSYSAAKHSNQSPALMLLKPSKNAPTNTASRNQPLPITAAFTQQDSSKEETNSNTCFAHSESNKRTDHQDTHKHKEKSKDFTKPKSVGLVNKSAATPSKNYNNN
jgi:hypothetical protein